MKNMKKDLTNGIWADKLKTTMATRNWVPNRHLITTHILKGDANHDYPNPNKNLLKMQDRKTRFLFPKK